MERYKNRKTSTNIESRANNDCTTLSMFINTSHSWYILVTGFCIEPNYWAVNMRKYCAILHRKIILLKIWNTFKMLCSCSEMRTYLYLLKILCSQRQKTLRNKFASVQSQFSEEKSIWFFTWIWFSSSTDGHFVCAWMLKSEICTKIVSVKLAQLISRIEFVMHTAVARLWILMLILRLYGNAICHTISKVKEHLHW